MRTPASKLVAGLATAGLLSLPMALVTQPPAAADSPDSKLLLVLDSSGSMKEPDRSGMQKIDAAKQALSTVVGALPEDAHVGLRVYGATVFDRNDPGACTDTQLVVPVGPADKSALRNAIGRYRPYGETPIAHSLREAAKDLGATGKRTIVLVSDGEETCNPDPCLVAQQLHAQGIDLTINVVGMSVRGKARQQLRCIADKAGGRYVDADDASDLIAGLEQTALRDFRPFELTGTPVDGGLDQGSAPSLEPGLYTDHLGGKAEPDATKYYNLLLTPGSTLHVGFTAWPASHQGGIGWNDWVTLRLNTPDGTRCAHAIQGQMQAFTRSLLVEDLSYGPQTSGPDVCAQQEQLVLEVQRGRQAPERGRIPFELHVVVEPPLASEAGLPEPARRADQALVPVRTSVAKGEVAGGGSFTDAPILLQGTWTDTLQPGEALFYRVRADWGQAPAVTFRIGPSNSAESLGVQGLGISLDAYGPVRQHITRLPAIVNQRTADVADTLSVGLVPVRHRNRQSGDVSVRATCLAGDYYVALLLEDSPTKLQLPVQISVALIGTPNGKPQYQATAPAESKPAKPKSPISPSPSADTSPDERGEHGNDQTTSTASDRPANSTFATISTLGVAGGLIVIGLLIALGLLRRPSSKPQ